jgi:hypothetical protein
MFIFDAKIVKPSKYIEYYDNFNIIIKDQISDETIENLNIDIQLILE